MSNRLVTSSVYHKPDLHGTSKEQLFIAVPCFLKKWPMWTKCFQLFLLFVGNVSKHAINKTHKRLLIGEASNTWLILCSMFLTIGEPLEGRGGGQTVIRIRLLGFVRQSCVWWIVETIDTRFSVVCGFSKNFVSEVKLWRVTQFATESRSDLRYRFDFNLIFLFSPVRFVQYVSLLSLSGSTNNSSSRFLASSWPISPLLLLVRSVCRKRLSSLWSCLPDENARW